MLILKPNEKCPYSKLCPYNSNNSCQGTNSNRNIKFTCNFITNGIFKENGLERNKFDITGKMKIIME